MFKPLPKPQVYKGKEYPSIKALCKAHDISTGVFGDRRKRGMSVEDAIDTPRTKSDGKTIAAVGKTHGVLSTGHDGSNLGVRSNVTKSLFEIFTKHGMSALEEAIKREVTDPDKVLPFLKTYLMPLIPKDSLLQLDGGTVANNKQQTMVINIDKAYMPNVANLEAL